MVNGRERKHFTFLLNGMSDFILLLELLEKFWTGFLQIGLTFNIKNVIGLKLRIDIVLGSVFLRHPLVVIIFNFLLRLFIDNGESCDEDWKTLGSLIDRNKRKIVTLAVLGFLLGSLLVFYIVQACDTVKGCPYRQLVALLFGMEHQHHAVHSVVLPSA